MLAQAKKGAEKTGPSSQLKAVSSKRKLEKGVNLIVKANGAVLPL